MSRSRLKPLIEQLQTSERGVSAVFIALAMILMMGFVALGIDISVNTHERQQLWDALDASSLAGAQFLPDADAALLAAQEYADSNWPGLSPDVDFWCVVGVNSSGNPETSHIPAMCDPGPPPYNVATYPGLECNDRMCYIPCNPATGTCNTIRVSAEEAVDFHFARIIGFNQGSTGELTSASCKGPCGAEISVPGDIALVLDRTGSMRAPGDIHIHALQDASTAFLEGLSPSNHHVALGTIGRTSANPGSCSVEPSSSDNSGPWIPIPLSDDYDLTDNDPPDSPPSLNPSSDLVQAINCLDETYSSTRTNLGDSIAAAGDFLVANGRPEVPDGIVFMTDGEANEPTGNNSCVYANQQASQVKNQDVIVVTIAYRLQGVRCGDNTLATTLLASMASDPEPGVETLDDHGGCDTTPEATAENADGDLFFCAPGPGLLSSVFSQASSAILAQFAERTILVKPPS